MTSKRRTTSLPAPAVSPIDLLISDLLRDSGMTQAAVARRLGLSRPSVSDRFRGRTRWTTAELPVVAQMLGMSVSDLLEDVR